METAANILFLFLQALHITMLLFSIFCLIRYYYYRKAIKGLYYKSFAWGLISSFLAFFLFFISLIYGTLLGAAFYAQATVIGMLPAFLVILGKD